VKEGVMATSTMQRSRPPGDVTPAPSPPTERWGPGWSATVAWVALVIVALASIGLLGTTTFGWLVPTAALGLVVMQWRRPPIGVVWARWHPDRRDLRAIAVFYVGVVALFRLAFGVFTVDRVAGLFLTFAAGLILGVAGPVVYTVWRRRRPLSDLGISRERLPATIGLALGFGAAQFAVTLLGYDLPQPVDWVPLLVMALVVGIFETIFFRGFVQNRLEASAGTLPGLGGAAALYSLYHVGFGMGAADMLFLFGLGTAYAIAFRLVRNGLVLWPLLTPLGSFFANLEAGDIDLPWAAIAGFIDVAAVMVTVIVLAHRHRRRTSRPVHQWP
jgi:membrane protease YdiL (CAAX protease family)